MRNQYRSYTYGDCVSTKEVIRHVATVIRPDVDPVFASLAHEAALNGCDASKNYTYGGGYCAAQGVTFGRPTTVKGGYFNTLKYIVEHPDCRRKDIYNEIGNHPTTLNRLIDGGLIVHTPGKHTWVATDLGAAYLTVAQKYVADRNM